MLSLTDKIWIDVKSVYTRVTFNRFTAAFFLFGFIHCFAQGMIQAVLFSIDSTSSSFLSNIIQEAAPPHNEIAWFTSYESDIKIQLCTDIPYGNEASACVPIFETGQSSLTVPAGFRRELDERPLPSAALERRDMGATNPLRNSSGDIDGIEVIMSGQDPFTLNLQCTRMLLYPSQILENFKREDVTLIFVQFWLFSVSFAAVFYDSVPHTLAILLGRILTTIWSGYSMYRTEYLRPRFETLILGPDSPCQQNLLPTFFRSRRGFEIADLTLNCTALVISLLLSTNLLRVYSGLTFKRVGPPTEIVRIYRYFLALFVFLQLSGFLLVTAMGLWIDQLFNTAIAHISQHTNLYLALFLFTAIALVPWLSMGWFAVRRERKHLMTAFLGIGFLFIAGWSIMFYSQVYRWQFTQWPLFASITIASFLTLISSSILGILCWRNFDKGLAHYLYVEEVLGSADFEHAAFPNDVEKGSFERAHKLERIPSSCSTCSSSSEFPIHSKKAPSVVDNKRQTSASNWDRWSVEGL